jgi:hypothetical protein
VKVRRSTINQKSRFPSVNSRVERSVRHVHYDQSVSLLVPRKSRWEETFTKWLFYAIFHGPPLSRSPTSSSARPRANVTPPTTDAA